MYAFPKKHLECIRDDSYLTDDAHQKAGLIEGYTVPYPQGLCGKSTAVNKFLLFRFIRIAIDREVKTKEEENQTDLQLVGNVLSID